MFVCLYLQSTKQYFVNPQLYTSREELMKSKNYSPIFDIILDCDYDPNEQFVDSTEGKK